MLTNLQLAGLVAVVLGLLLLYRPIRVLAQRYDRVATLFFAVVAGLYVLVEYRDTQQEGRLKQTLSYIQRVQSGDVADARRWFDVFWLKHSTLRDEFNAADAAGDNTQAKAALNKLEKAASADPQGAENIMRMFYFYSDLSACSNLGICDRETACAMFLDDIGNHHFFFADFVNKWTKVSFSGKMDEVMKFVESC